MKNKEQYKTLTVNGSQFEVGCYGTIKLNGVMLKHHRNNKTRYVSVSTYNSKTHTPRNYYVHRLVAMAWVPCPNGDVELYQVDHLNGKRDCNRYTNLRFISRKKNNSRLHARRLKSKNHKHTRHNGFMVKAEKDNITKYFRNAAEASRWIGCSGVLAYYALNPNHYQRTAYGWKLEYVEAA